MSTDPTPACDGRTREDGIVISWTGVDARRRRMTFEPRSAGGYTRIVERKTDAGWVPVGNEIVSDVDLDPGAERLG